MNFRRFRLIFRENIKSLFLWKMTFVIFFMGIIFFWNFLFFYLFEVIGKYWLCFFFFWFFGNIFSFFSLFFLFEGPPCKFNKQSLPLVLSLIFSLNTFFLVIFLVIFLVVVVNIHQNDSVFPYFYELIFLSNDLGFIKKFYMIINELKSDKLSMLIFLLATNLSFFLFVFLFSFCYFLIFVKEKINW